MEKLLKVLRRHTIDNPIHSYELERRFKIRGCEVRDVIRRLRRAGKPIATSRKGYYYARSRAEIDSTIKNLLTRAYSLIDTVKLLKSNARI